MLIIPLSHHKSEVRRTPYVTIGILAINILLFIVTVLVEPSSRLAAIQAEEKLVTFYLANTNLEMPKDTYNKLSPASRQSIHAAKEIMKHLDTESDRINEMTQTFETDQSMPEDKETGSETEEFNVPDTMPGMEGMPDTSHIPGIKFGVLSPKKMDKAKAQTLLNELIKDFESASGSHFYRKYGYVPSEGGFFSLLSSMFLHGGFFHLLGNMLFLWLCGCNIEDLWGRIIYPIFYVISGIIATMTHVWFFSKSNTPLIGASGAIAGLMGAFLIRHYDANINFFYLYFFGLKMRKGFFKAPAYIMLPLWILQQVWEGIVSVDTGSGGTAFWSHIGGFVFGVIVALGFKFLHIEEKYVEPDIEEKTNLLDQNFSKGVQLFEQGHFQEAAEALRKAAAAYPNDPMIHRELCRSNIILGNSEAAEKSLNRAIRLLIGKKELETALEIFMEMNSMNPAITPEPSLYMKIAGELERQEKFQEAVTAYRSIFEGEQQKYNTLDMPVTIEALTRYADLTFERLRQPHEAAKLYDLLLKSCTKLTDAAKAEIQKKAGFAQKAAAQQSSPSAVKIKQKASIPAPAKKKLNIPMDKRIRIADQTLTTAKYRVATVAPLEANKVLPALGGLDFKRLNEKPVRFDAISFLCVFSLRTEPGSQPKVDVFIAGQSRPYRISAKQIAFNQFIQKPDMQSAENLRRFILHVISNIDCVYVDSSTMNFLKTRKVAEFADQNSLEIHEKTVWGKLMGDVRAVCDSCTQIYWIDGRKIPDAGFTTTCKVCGQKMTVQGKKGLSL